MVVSTLICSKCGIALKQKHLEFYNLLEHMPFLTVSGTTCRPDSFAFSPNRKQVAPRTARYFFANKTGEFSPENSRDKMPRMAFYPAFQGSGFRLHCLTATRSAPFQSGLGLVARTLFQRKIIFANCFVFWRRWIYN